MSRRAPERWMLRLLPRDLREEYGEDFIALLRERVAEEETNGGRVAALRYWLRGLADALRTTVRSVLGTGPRGSGAPSPGRPPALSVPDTVARDLTYATRQLRRSPGFTVVAVLTLAVGIGGNGAIFSLFHQFLLRPLPVEDPERLVNLNAPGVKSGSTSSNIAGGSDALFSYPMFRDLERIQTVFTGIAAHCGFAATLGYGGEMTEATGMLVSGSYFQVLGLEPAMGRLIGPNDDDAIGESAVAVLSHSYWQARFGGDPSILNDTLVVNGEPMAIIGVAPEGFDGTTLGMLPEVFVPITVREVVEPHRAGNFDQRRSYWLYLFARLQPGTDIEGARGAVGGQYSAIINEVEAPLQTRMSEATLAEFRARQIVIEEGARGQSLLHSNVLVPLTILNAVAGLIFLIACANVAGLLLTRGASRSGEMAVRLSVGASRRHLIGQLVTESLLLATAGGVAALLVSRWTLALLTTLLRAGVAPGRWWEAQVVASIIDLSLNGSVVAFTAATALGAGVLFGLFPALVSTRANVLGALKGVAGLPAGVRSAARFRAVLTTGQIALSMVLLAAAALFIRSLAAVSRIELGLDAADVITFGISPERNGYEPAASRELFERTEDALAALPGVTRATASMVPLLAGSSWSTNVRVEGFEGGPDVDSNSSYNYVGSDYFRTLGITMLAGRGFTESDALGAPLVAVVNAAFARKFGLGRAVGRRIDGLGGRRELDIEIVGLVQDTKYDEVKEGVPPQFFLPYRQSESVGSMTFYVRSEIDARQQLAAIAPLVEGLDPNLPVENLRTLQMQLEENTLGDRVISKLSAAFAALATLLAAVGLYGVLAFTVARRRREIIVRVALGAAPGTVRRLVLRQMAWMTLIGGMLGLAAALMLGHLAGSLFYGISGHDPVALAAAALLLALISLAAGWIPAHRATRVDPMQALRAE